MAGDESGQLIVKNFLALNVHFKQSVFRSLKFNEFFV